MVVRGVPPVASAAAVPPALPEADQCGGGADGLKLPHCTDPASPCRCRQTARGPRHSTEEEGAGTRGGGCPRGEWGGGRHALGVRVGLLQALPPNPHPDPNPNPKANQVTKVTAHLLSPPSMHMPCTYTSFQQNVPLLRLDPTIGMRQRPFCCARTCRVRWRCLGTYPVSAAACLAGPPPLPVTVWLFCTHASWSGTSVGAT